MEVFLSSPKWGGSTCGCTRPSGEAFSWPSTRCPPRPGWGTVAATKEICGMDLIEQFSAGLADRVAAAASFTVGIETGKRPASGILWRPDVVVASEQMLPEDAAAMRV